MSAFGTYMKLCICGHKVPHHVTPVSCFHCAANLNRRTSTIGKFKNVDAKLTVRPTYTLCSGICGQKVPTHVTPDKCRYCANLKVCDGLCKKFVNIHTTADTCYDCDLIRFPYVKCATDGCDAQVRKVVKCDTCAEEDRRNAWIENLIAKFGPINPDYAIEIRIKGIGGHHTGYSCYTPFDVEDVDIDYMICLPAFDSAIAKCKRGSYPSLDDPILNDPIAVKHFKSNRIGTRYDIEPIMNFYINELNLERITYPGTCGCGGFPKKPRVKTISVVKIGTGSDPHDFYTLRK
jgi:hypothetical protein